MRLISFVIPHYPAIISLTDPETSANNDWLTIQRTADSQVSPNNLALFWKERVKGTIIYKVKYRRLD